MSDTFDGGPSTPLPVPGWYRDPAGHGDARYWNGVAWTDSVSRGNVGFQSPMPDDQVRVPPIPGSEYRAPPAAPAASPAAAAAPPPPRSSGPTLLVAIAVAGAIVLLVLLLFTLVFDGDDDAPPPTEVPPVPTAALPDTTPDPTPAPPTDPPAESTP